MLNRIMWLDSQVNFVLVSYYILRPMISYTEAYWFSHGIFMFFSFLGGDAWKSRKHGKQDA